VLTRATLNVIRAKLCKHHPKFDGSLVVYGEQSRLTQPMLDRENVVFKQTPYDVKARR
jgi:adenine-specific DNA-methyltransferase